MAKKEQQTTKQEIPVNEVKKEEIQVHFGNSEKIKILLLQAIAKNTAEICRILRDVKESK